MKEKEIETLTSDSEELVEEYMTENKINAIIKQLYSNVISKPRKCLVHNCQEFAINSHVLQKNGILNKLTDVKNHLYEIDYDIFKESKFYFKYKGANDTLTFKGFCNKHDTNLFKEIEKQSFKLSDYQVALLFTYRAMMMERRKKLNIIEWYQDILASSLLADHIIRPFYIDSIEGEKLAVSDGEYYENLILENINNPGLTQFSFITREIEFIEICASAVYTYETSNELNIRTNQESHPTEIYFHVIPFNGQTTVIMGCLNDRKPICWNYINQIINCPKQKLLKKISSLVLKNVETWACSHNFYMKAFKPKERKIMKILEDGLVSNNERKELNLNLFN